MSLSRREVLKRFAGSISFLVASSTPLILSADKKVKLGESRYSFPQGIASGDPQPGSIMLWTRVVDSMESDGPIELSVQMAMDADFNEVILEQKCAVDEQLDNTLRCFVEGLQPDRHFFYRFVTPDGGVSRTGRTRTAPAPDAEKELVAAVFSCQQFQVGFFSAYRRLIKDDVVREKKVDLLLHVGDFIYEQDDRNVKFGGLNSSTYKLSYLDGSPRDFGEFPSGGDDTKIGWKIARTLDDYRHLYRTYLSDPDLQDARAMYPFVHVWDDHEVRNDYWQGYDLGGPLQTKKLAGNQAWFEYMPMSLTKAPAGPAGVNHAHDFRQPTIEIKDVVEEQFDENYLGHGPNNLAAIDSISIYRCLSWGSMVDLILVDGRSYRGPRGMPDSILREQKTAYPLDPVDPQIIEILNAGRTASNGNPPDTINVRGVETANPRKNAPFSSMLGYEQKRWFKSTLLKSTARWKAICNNTPMMRFGFDTTFRENGIPNGILWSDSWDGYPIERREILSFIRDQKVKNVVSLTGDRHAHFAGLVYDDFDSSEPRAVIPELAGTSVSATCRLVIQHHVSKLDKQLNDLVQFYGPNFGFKQKMMPALNAWLLYGHGAARALHETGSVEMAMEKANPAINSHLVYADTDAYGYYLTHFTSERVKAEFVTVPEPSIDFGTEGPPAIRRVQFEVPAWEAGQEPKIVDLKVEGTVPLLGIKSTRQT